MGCSHNKGSHNKGGDVVSPKGTTECEINIEKAKGKTPECENKVETAKVTTESALPVTAPDILTTDASVISLIAAAKSAETWSSSPTVGRETGTTKDGPLEPQAEPQAAPNRVADKSPEQTPEDVQVSIEDTGAVPLVVSGDNDGQPVVQAGNSDGQPVVQAGNGVQVVNATSTSSSKGPEAVKGVQAVEATSTSSSKGPEGKKKKKRVFKQAAKNMTQRLSDFVHKNKLAPAGSREPAAGPEQAAAPAQAGAGNEVQVATSDPRVTGAASGPKEPPRVKTVGWKDSIISVRFYRSNTTISSDEGIVSDTQ